MYAPHRTAYGGLRGRGTLLWDKLEMWYSVCMPHDEQYAVALGDRGRLVLPAPLRRRLDLQPGDRLVITVDPEGGFHVVSAREQARRLQGFYRDRYPGRSLVADLIAERREEARREEAE